MTNYSFLTKISALNLMVLIFSGCENKGLNENLERRKTPLTKTEVSGQYKGSYVTDLYNTAAIVNVNPDGTFVARIFIFGDEQTENGISPMKGRYTIRHEIQENKNAYGESTSTTYLHGIDFHAETQWGTRTSTYLITNGFNLEPVGLSYIDEKAILKKVHNN